MSCAGDNYLVPGADPCINESPISLPYTLTGTTAGATIANRGTISPLPINTFSLISQITFKIPFDWSATDSIYYDGWNLSDYNTNFNSFWGVTYITNTFATPTEILGSITNVNNSLQYSNFNQIYLPLNLIIPPTYITPGGTITLKIYCNPTSINHYLTVTPINNARIGLASN